MAQWLKCMPCSSGDLGLNLGQDTMYVEFACSRCVCMGIFPYSKNMLVGKVALVPEYKLIMHIITFCMPVPSLGN